MIFRFLKIIFIFIVTGITLSGLSQNFNIENPYIVNYSKADYLGGTENWKILTTHSGLIYVANNEGLMEYNGSGWKKHSLPNKTIVRSIAIDTVSKRIYAGGQDEVGYFYADKNGLLTFQSIKSFLPPQFALLEDVWDMQTVGNKVFFRSVNSIFEFSNNKIQVLSTTSSTINFLKYIDGRLFFGDPNIGLFVIENQAAVKVQGSEIFKNQRVSDIIINEDGNLLFVTETNGIFSYNNHSFTSFLKDSRLNKSILNASVRIHDNLIAFGSVLKGIIFTDTKGNYLFNITKKQGLQNNAVISLSLDSNGNIWAGTTNGIDQVLINSPFTSMYPDLDLQGGVYAVKIFQNKLYAGTNNGLFYTPWPNTNRNSTSPTFTQVKNTDGQVWALDIVQGDLFMGHKDGAFIIKNDVAVKISKDFSGAWCFIELSQQNKMIAGSYAGLHLYEKVNNSWSFIKDLEGFKESARIIAKDIDGNIWVSHPYRGVYKITLDASYSNIMHVKIFGIKQGLPSNLNNYVTSLNKKIYVTGGKGIFVYDDAVDKFLPDEKLIHLLGNNINIRRLFQENNEDIWYVNENDCGVLFVQDSPVTKIVQKHNTPFLSGKLIGGFENIYIPDQNHVFVCTDKGLILINLDKLKRRQELILRINEINSSGKEDIIIYGGHDPVHETIPSFPYLQNSIKISVGTNRIDITDPVTYAWKLKGHDREWSSWNTLSEKEFSNLSPGTYEINVKASDSKGNESNVLTYGFKILRPWYSSNIALLFYFFLLLAGIMTLIKTIDRKHEYEKTQLKQEKEQTEAKVEELINENLQNEIIFKNKELALSTMHIVQKNETLVKLREELDSIIKTSKDPDAKNQIKKIINILSDDQKLEDDWESFALHFDQVHTDFLRRIKEKFSNLSPKDLKLCAYLRMNLTSKEIAPLLNISVRGVEISRYRLRKKMDIDVDINLNEFMMQF